MRTYTLRGESEMADRGKALERLLHSFEAYYQVNRETPAAPFVAEAFFSLHDEQYFLVRSAKISEAESREYVFFYSCAALSDKDYLSLCEKAWQEGLSRVCLGDHHRNSDVSLIILSDFLDDASKKSIKKTRRYKSYRLGLSGWSDFRVIAVELSSGTLVYNRKGEILKKSLSNILS